MVSPWLIALFTAFISYRFYKFCFYRPDNFPPGPPRIPLFGSYLFLLLINHIEIHLAIRKLCKFYKSSVVGFYLTNQQLCVVTSDEKSTREVLLNSDFDGRPGYFLVSRLRDPNYQIKGIFFTEGDYWTDQRRFALRNLRDFGFGRRYEMYEIEVRDEMQALVSMIKEGPRYEHEKPFLKKGAVLLPKALIGCLGNCFLQIISNERLPRSEQAQLIEAGYGAIDFQKNTNEYGKLFSIAPWVRFLFPQISSFEIVRKASMKMCDLMKLLIEKQKKSYEDGFVRNFIDVYIKQIKEAEEKGVNNGFLYDQLLMICTDFLFPSLSAMESQVSYLLKNLLYRQDVLHNIQKEIDCVVGSGRLPGLDDRVNLPYTEASLREIMRFETLVPSSVPHQAIRDTTLSGYAIPKGTVLMAGLFELHNNKNIWVDPENFRPERFLNADGSLNLKEDVSLPFGAGRRLCAGETFARNTMFLCIATLLQNFNPKPLNGVLPDLNASICGLTRIPDDFWVELEAR